MPSHPIRIRARLNGDMTEVTMLLAHPMETGLRKDGSGALVAAHYITDVRVAAEGRVVLEARLSQAVSQDPLISFRFRGGKQGGLIAVSWTDSQGDQRQDEVVVS
jgi:sulfur-oxidizing protein SoxZ